MNSATARGRAAAPETANRSCPPNVARIFGKNHLLGELDRDALADRDWLSLASLGLRRQSGLKHPPDGSRLRRHEGLHARMDLVPDPRHREEDRRLDQRQVLRELGRVSANARRRACGDRHVQLHAAAEDMRPGQKSEPAVVRLQVDDREQGAHVEREVPMGQDHPLRRPGGARGVDQGRDVLPIRHARGQWVTLAISQQGRVGAWFVGRTVEVHDVLEFRQRGAKRLDALRDGLVGDEAHNRVRVRKDVLPLLVELRLVHGYVSGAKPVGGVGAHRPFEAVVRDDRDGIPAVDAQARQAGAELVHQAPELAERRPYERAGPRYPEEGSSAVGFDGATQHIDEIRELLPITLDDMGHCQNPPVDERSCKRHTLAATLARLDRISTIVPTSMG